MKNNDYTDKNFFDILVENDQDKIHDFILVHGKSGKPVSPIMFIKDEDEKDGGN